MTQAPSEDASARVAYLVTLYPKLSHTFIAQEITALRRRGVEVSTFSVRPSPPAEVLSAHDRAERDSTTVLVDSMPDTVRTALRFASRHPAALLAGLRLALRSGPPGAKSRLWQLFYLVECIPLVVGMEARGLRHVHVHLANNSADIARLAVRVGSVVTGQRWTWSLAMHGPTEFADVERFDLAAKIESALFVACISDYCRSQLMAVTEVAHWSKLHIVRMGIDLSRYSYAQRHRDPDEPLRVLFVGRLVPEKAPQLLVQAVEQLPSRSTIVRLVGDGPLRARLDREARRVGQTCTVEVLGPIGQDEIVEHYRWADVFCLPSFAEGLPVVIMEAQATGLPVVATAIAGIPELVQDGQTGLLVFAGRTDLLESALTTLRDAELRARLGRQGADLVRADHDGDVNAEALAELFSRYAWHG